MTKELWQTTYEWLQLHGIRINKEYCREELTTHPDYPALTSVVDLLDSGGMTYKALQTDASYIPEFNYPLLAHIRQPGNEYMIIIPDIAAWDEQNEITRDWTGIVLFPQKDPRWKNEQNDLCQLNEQKNKLFIAALIITGLAVFTLSTFRTLTYFLFRHGGLLSLFGLFSLIGLVISLFALSAELGFQSQLVRQVCGAINKGGCEQVLKSRYAKGFAGISPADISVLYFFVQFMAYALIPLYSVVLSGAMLLAIGGIGVAALSIYLQAFRLRQWCALCLGIVAVLLVQVLIVFMIPLHTISYVGLGAFILLLLLLLPIYLTIRQLVKTNKSNKVRLAELKRWKYDAGLFMSQWQQEQEVDVTVWPNDLLMGDPDAPILITIACNPYCGPCAKAHRQLDTLIRRYPRQVKVLIRLLCTVENEQDRRTVAARAILQKAGVLENPQELQPMLTDWFEWMDYDKWGAKWGRDNSRLVDGEEVKRRLVLHGQWIERSNVAFTPTFFVNGRRLPGRYSLEDLELLIPQLAEQL